ncbi:GDP-mannose-dependent alpha-(1-6)-phosphatidylinositol monomannoside mannosyltransferase [termite gut metagenome]|uniref:GDP-mannose-dependent alpha-(1-6)-phosphatidylinositol monomannoside mannosyltransferase n=1 Tax=termite gut metagenome TaxID=433724 RepID=A0A5J4SCI6_9ZZZZ
MKVAIIQEWLVSVGGAEKVVKAIADVFPDADVYALVTDKKACDELGFNYSKIKTSFIQRLPFGKIKYRMFLPIMPFAIEQFDLRDYDVILSSSHAVAKGVLTRSDQLHICYCHTPVRYAWDLYHEYLHDAGLNRGLKGLFVKYVLHRLRQWDVLSNFRVDYFISNSNYIAKRIKKIYNREAVTIYPNVDMKRFELYREKEDFYLASSRLVAYKRIDLIVEAFNRMPDKKLVVIGGGPCLKKIQKIAGTNVTVMGYQPFEVLKEKMCKAKAFVFAADEDFGIFPVEAQACGTPVIAYGKGGSLETVSDGKTGIFFKEQTIESVIDAVKRFEAIQQSFNPINIRKFAESFSEERFKKEIKDFVEHKYATFNKAD